MVQQPMYQNSDPPDGVVLPWSKDTRDAPGPFARKLSDLQFRRIDTLRREIAAGNYRVPTAALADALIQRMTLPQRAMSAR